MYEFDIDVEFEEAWTNLIANYNVQENNWLKSTYASKAKLVACYMKEALTLGIQSTQLSENSNSNFKACMKLDLVIKQFLKRFEQAVEEKRKNELHCECDSLHKLVMLLYEMSPILIQMDKVYGHTSCLICFRKSLHHS